MQNSYKQHVRFIELFYFFNFKVETVDEHCKFMPNL